MTIPRPSRAAGSNARTLWKAASEPLPGWFLLWLPLILAATDDSPSLARAMVHLTAVLLIGYLAWARGRGPAGPWAERIFVGLSLVVWFAAIGVALWDRGSPQSLAARLGLAAGLLLGPAFVSWAWRRRLALVPVDRFDLPQGAASRVGLVRLTGLVLVAMLMLDRLLGFERADLLVVAAGLGLYGVFRVQGRAPAPRGLV